MITYLVLDWQDFPSEILNCKDFPGEILTLHEIKYHSQDGLTDNVVDYIVIKSIVRIVPERKKSPTKSV